MTNKEAIEILKGIYPDGAYNQHEEQRLEAINMAIAALANTQECHVVETLRTEYEKGRYDMREEMMKDAIDVVVTYMATPISEHQDAKSRVYICVDEHDDNRQNPKLFSKAKLLFEKED